MPVCTLQKRKKCSTKSIKKSMYWYVLSTYRYIPFQKPAVCTRYILLSSSMYFKTYISDQYVLICTGYIHGTYLRKIVCTWYILGVKSMYRVHTGLCRFIAVPYYSMVHTGLYSVHTGMNLVHDTTGHDHDSRCQFFKANTGPKNSFLLARKTADFTYKALRLITVAS